MLFFWFCIQVSANPDRWDNLYILLTISFPFLARVREMTQHLCLARIQKTFLNPNQFLAAGKRKKKQSPPWTIQLYFSFVISPQHKTGGCASISRFIILKCRSDAYCLICIVSQKVCYLRKLNKNTWVRTARASNCVKSVVYCLFILLTLTCWVLDKYHKSLTICIERKIMTKECRVICRLATYRQYTLGHFMLFVIFPYIYSVGRMYWALSVSSKINP